MYNDDGWLNESGGILDDCAAARVVAVRKP